VEISQKIDGKNIKTEPELKWPEPEFYKQFQYLKNRNKHEKTEKFLMTFMSVQ
jgi:hypothetical protein